MKTNAFQPQTSEQSVSHVNLPDSPNADLSLCVCGGGACERWGLNLRARYKDCKQTPQARFCPETNPGEAKWAQIESSFCFSHSPSALCFGVISHESKECSFWHISSVHFKHFTNRPEEMETTASMLNSEGGMLVSSCWEHIFLPPWAHVLPYQVDTYVRYSSTWMSFVPFDCPQGQWGEFEGTALRTMRRMDSDIDWTGCNW